MLCRALLAAVAISYLICVLLLSGIQKEDLDVSMLQKLQRHNVNINDLNNEEIRRQCLTQSTTESVTSTKRIERETGGGNQNKTNINIFTETLPESEYNGKNVVRTHKTDVDKFIRFFSDQKKFLIDNINSESKSNSRKVLTTQEYIENDKTDMYTDIITTTARSTLINTNMEQIIRLFNDQRKILEEKIKFDQESNIRKTLTTQEYIEKDKNTEKIFNIHTTVTPTTENINEKLFIEYDKGQAKLDSVIRFWQMYVKNNKTNDKTRNIETENETKPSPKMLTDGIIYHQIHQPPQVTQSNLDNIAINNYQENKYRDTKNSANTYNENNYRNSRTIENNFYLQNKYRQAQNNTNNNQENRNINLEYNENNYRTNRYTGFDINPNDNYGNRFREPKINVNNYRENVYGDFKINPVNYNQENRYTYQGNRYSEPQIYANEYQNNNRRLSESNSNYQQEKMYAAIQNNANNNNENKYNNPKNNANPYYHENQYRVTQNSHNNYRKNNGNNSENNESKEIEHISKLISKFLSKKRTKPENDQNFKLSLVSQQLNSFLANKALNPVKKDIIEQDQKYMEMRERKIPLPYDVNNSKDKLIIDEIVNWPNKSNNKNTNLNHVDTYDNKKELDKNEDYKTTHQQKVTTLEDKPDITTYHQNEKPTEKYPKSIDKVEGHVSENDPMKHLSPEIVRQIAESIKEIVLKDLRRDISSTNASTTTTSATTTSVFTTTSLAPTSLAPTSLAPTSLAPTTLTDLQTTTKELNLTKVQKASQAIEQFIDLIEQIKYFREKPVETPEAKYKITENIDENNGYSVPINMMYQAPPEMPALNPYGVKASHLKQSPMVVNPFVQQANGHEPQPWMGQKQNTINIITKTPPQDAPLINTNPINMMYQAPPQMPALNPYYGVKATFFSSPMKQSPMIVNPFVQQANDHEPQPRMGQKQSTINIITKTPPQYAPLMNTNPINMMYQAPQQMPALNPYGVKASLFSSPIKQSPMMVNRFVQQANNHEPQSWMGQKQNTINLITKTPPQDAPLININQFKPAPIVIQTDQNEIPPLVITLSQPSPINHNIVVSTEFPYFMNNADRQRWQYMAHYGRNPDTKEDIVKRKEILNSYSNLDFTKRTRELENSKHSGLSGKFEDWEAMFHSHKNDSAKMRTGTKPNVFSYPYNKPHNLEHDRGYPRDHNIRGFHERLESLGQWPQEQKFEHREENTESKVSSRQQIPINMKVGSKYDDTHFRNFLMTQQKVNDMLESILAANIRPDDGPRSVESI